MLQIGMTVEILPSAQEYRRRYTGHTGVIMSMYSGSPVVGVQFENYKNPASKYGFFWFNAKGLRNVDLLNFESEELIMLKDYTFANIKFMDGTNTNCTYSYALYDPIIKEGDVVVVKTGHHGLALATIAEIAPDISEPVKFGREIIAKVDFSAYNARKEKAEKIAKLKKTMDEKVRELQHNAIYEMLAEKDPALKAMLDEYKTLTTEV